MHDVEIELQDCSGDLARIGETLGSAGISVEGGGMWRAGGSATAHFLVADGPGAARALEASGLSVVACRDVVLTSLDQERPGQLGGLCRAMADAGVDIEVLYSDHAHELVLVVDDPERARTVFRDWSADPG